MFGGGRHLEILIEDGLVRTDPHLFPSSSVHCHGVLRCTNTRIVRLGEAKKFPNKEKSGKVCPVQNRNYPF